MPSPHRWILAGLLCLLALPAAGQEKSFRLKAAQELIENGTLKYLLPRFSLKTGVKVAVERLELPVDVLWGADAFLAQAKALPQVPGAADKRVVFAETGGRSYALVILKTERQDYAGRFLDWLTSSVGERAIAAIKVDGATRYNAVAIETTEEVAAAATGDAVLGEEIAFRRCGRCHVISKKNRFGGIGSTPSFGALKTLPEWQKRFEAFWTLNPHPAFTQIKGVTPPFDPARPPPIAPLELTLDEVEALMAFVRSIKPKDLGGPLIAQ